MKLFELPLRDKFNVEPLSNSATVATTAVVIKKKEFHCVTPLRETCVVAQ